MSATATRVFMNGNSQAVRIPKQFQLDAHEVEIFRNDDGDLVIHPLPTRVANRGAALMRALGGFSDDFADALQTVRDDQPTMQDREAL
jgi:antitoxin VapB